MNIRQEIINREFQHFEKYLKQCRWNHVTAGLIASFLEPLTPNEIELTGRPQRACRLSKKMVRLCLATVAGRRDHEAI